MGQDCALSVGENFHVSSKTKTSQFRLPVFHSRRDVEQLYLEKFAAKLFKALREMPSPETEPCATAVDATRNVPEEASSKG